VSDSVWPHKRQPTRLPCPWDSLSKNTGVGCHFLLQCMKVRSESEVAQSCQTLSDPMDCSPPGSSIHGIFQARVLEWGAIAFSIATPWIATWQAPPSMGFSKQEYWSGVPLPYDIYNIYYTSWQIDGEQWKQWQTFFLDSKVTGDGDCSHEVKRLLLLGRKVMTNLDSILKSRDITLPKKAHLVKAMFFPVVMYGCESWTLKKAECLRIDGFELWCWRRLLRVPWTARRSNQSILKEISPKCSLEGLMLKLKLQYFGHLMQRTDSLEKTLMLGKMELNTGGEGNDRGWDGWMSSLTQWTWVWVNSRSWWWTGRPGVLQSMGLQSRTWLRNWTELNWTYDSAILLWVHIQKNCHHDSKW